MVYYIGWFARCLSSIWFFCVCLITLFAWASNIIFIWITYIETKFSYMGSYILCLPKYLHSNVFIAWVWVCVYMCLCRWCFWLFWTREKLILWESRMYAVVVFMFLVFFYLDLWSTFKISQVVYQIFIHKIFGGGKPTIFTFDLTSNKCFWFSFMKCFAMVEIWMNEELNEWMNYGLNKWTNLFIELTIE